MSDQGIAQHGETVRLVLPADVERLPDVVDPLQEALARLACPHPTVDQLIVAVEELFVNVAHYAYPEDERPGEVRLAYTFDEVGPAPGGEATGHAVTIVIEDEGIPFDPVAKPDPTLPKSVEEVKIGGLGILMVRRTMDVFAYERRGQTNVTTISKRW